MRAKIGQILWISNQSHPDVRCVICFLALKLKAANVKDLLAVNIVIKKIKDNYYNIEYQPLGDKIKIVLFADAAFANHEDGGSQGGHLIFLVDENSRFYLISRQLKRITWIVCSSLAAETLALSDGVDHAIYLSVLLKEL